MVSYAFILIALLFSGCFQAKDDLPSPEAQHQERIQALLVGEDKRCERGDDCLSGVCLYSLCAGVLSTDEGWALASMTSRIQEELEGSEEHEARFMAVLAELYEQNKMSLSLQSRIISVFGGLGSPQSMDFLEGLDASETKEVAPLVALFLTQHGRQKGIPILLQELDKSSLADGFRVKALRALGAVPKEAQEREEVFALLLSYLNISSSTEEIRAANAALQSFGDQRALLPLFELYKKGRESLRHELSESLYALSEPKPSGLDLKLPDWEAYFQEHRAPNPPDYKPRDKNQEDDWFLPTP